MTALAEQDAKLDPRQEVYAFIGFHIAHYREWIGLTQSELGRLIGFKAPTIDKWEQGATIGIFDLLKVAAALGVPVASLLPRGEE